MARLARVVIPGLPHHVTQRGNGRAQTFFGADDYALYRDLLAASCRANDIEIWSWVLMPNHVHLILVPADEDGIRRALARSIAATPARSMPGCGAPAISGKAGSARWRWTRRIWPRRCGMWRSTRFAPAWLPLPRIGDGPACRRICPGGVHRTASGR